MLPQPLRTVPTRPRPAAGRRHLASAPAAATAVLLSIALSAPALGTPEPAARGLELTSALADTQARAWAAPISYTVRAGDTTWGIAARFRVPLATLVTANRLPDNGRLLHPGDVLRIPLTTSTSTTLTTTTTTTAPPPRTYLPEVLAAAARNRARLAKAKVPSAVQTRAILVSTAKRYGVDPALVLGVAQQESGFNQRAVSDANAIGVMQVLPSTGTWMSLKTGRRLDLLDAEDNITAGVALLDWLLSEAPLEEAVAGYYQGLAGVRKFGMYPHTERYVANVLALRTRWAAALDS